jgi:SAM-dependent methyltransferase
MSPPDPNDPRVVVGDAQNMPMPNECVDIIMNVEATHCYGDEGEFYQECMRILRPGGYLCWTDFRPIGWYEEKVFRLSAKAGLKVHLQQCLIQININACAVGNKARCHSWCIGCARHSNNTCAGILSEELVHALHVLHVECILGSTRHGRLS